MYDSEIITWLSSIGIEVAGNEVISGRDDQDTSEKLMRVAKRWTDSRHSSPWELDGVVIKLDRLDKRELLGMTPPSKVGTGMEIPSTGGDNSPFGCGMADRKDW